jgi:hypothetical protein
MGFDFVGLSTMRIFFWWVWINEDGRKVDVEGVQNARKMKIVLGFAKEIGFTGANEDNESSLAKATADVVALPES